MYYNSAAGSFLSKKLCSRLHSIEVDFYSKQVAQLSQRDCATHSYFNSQNCKVEFLSHSFGGLRGNVDASCVRRWKKRGRLHIGDD